MSIILDGSTGIVSDSSASNPAMTAKGNGSDVEGYIQLNCRVNSHGVKLKSPPHSSGQSYTMVLPDNQVAADKFLKVKSITGSGATAVGQLEYADASGGKFASYAIIADQKSSGTGGGTFTAGTQIRDINTEISDEDNIVSINNNIFTVNSGNYLIRASAPAYVVNEHQIILFKESGTQANLARGTSEYNNSSSGQANVRSSLVYRLTTSDFAGASDMNLQIRHQGAHTRSGNGFGVASSFGTETYTIVEIFKEA